MPIKKGQAPKQLPAELSISSAAEKLTLAVTYRNHTSKAFRDHKGSVAELVLLIVDKWDAEYPLTAEGVEEFEDEHPGICSALLEGWWQARTVSLEKN